MSFSTPLSFDPAFDPLLTRVCQKTVEWYLVVLLFGCQCILACCYITFVILYTACPPRIERRIAEKCGLEPLEVVWSNTLQPWRCWLQRRIELLGVLLQLSFE